MNDESHKPVHARPLREWMNAREATEHLRLPSLDALYQRVSRGQVRTYRLGRSLRFLRRDLDRLMSPGMAA